MAVVSFVIPIFNEEKAVQAFYDELLGALSDISIQPEIIFIDDGSVDSTWIILEKIQLQDDRVKLISLSRNFGHQAALLAGIEKSSGDCVITMDGDLEHPPEIIPQLIEKWQQGFEVVNTRRLISGSQLPFFKKVSSAVFYKIFRFLAGLDLEPGMADFRLLDRRVVIALQKVEEKALFLRGILQWIGFKQDIVNYQVGDRIAGSSKYSWKKMLQLALNGITSFSTIPLRLATLLGFVFSLLSFSYLTYAAYEWLFTDYTAEGWKAVIGLLLFLGGVQLICIGIIGEYIGRVFLEVKARPSYIVKIDKGFENV